jgi:hypothetical protein
MGLHDRPSLDATAGHIVLMALAGTLNCNAIWCYFRPAKNMLAEEAMKIIGSLLIESNNLTSYSI